MARKHQTEIGAEWITLYAQDAKPSAWGCTSCETGPKSEYLSGFDQRPRKRADSWIALIAMQNCFKQ